MYRNSSLALNLTLVSCSMVAIALGCESGCSKSDGQGGGSSSGGDGGASENGGAAGQAQNGGKGGTSDMGGKGGAAPMGGAAGVGSGGSMAGGTGGVMSGGASGMGGTPAPMDGCADPAELAGAGDAKVRVFCQPLCGLYRPNWPGAHICGPKGSVAAATPALKNSGFCAGQYNQDGVFTIPRTRLEPAGFSQATTGLSVANPVQGVVKAYLPSGEAEYLKAKDGEVAVTFWWSAFSNDSAHGISNIHQYLYSRGELPYTIAVFLDNGANKLFDEGAQGRPGKDFITRMNSLKNTVLPALIAKWPKISKDPAYRSISGQSTAGAEAFDAAWMYTDIIGKGIGGSSSVACFTCMGGNGTSASCNDVMSCRERNTTYAKDVMFCPARPIRWTSTVGTCDIFGTAEERFDPKLVPKCEGGISDGTVDASQCKATWPTINQDLADALKAKGTPYQLFKITGGEHRPTDWSIALPAQLRWAFKDITCKM